MGATEPIIWSDWRPNLSNLSSGWGKKEIYAPLFVLYLLYSTFEGKKGFPPIYSTESTDRVFLRYWYGNYQEIPTEYQP